MKAELLQVLGLVVAVGVLSGLAARVRILPPIFLVIAGVALSYLPGVPAYQLDPDVMLVLILPPLLYAAAIETSLPTFKANLRPIGLLAIGLVLFTVAVVGLTAYAVIPGLPLAAAFALGAIVGPPDAVAATSIARRTGLPRRVVAVLEGEGLINDATALVALRVALVAAASGEFAWQHAGLEFLGAGVGGVAIGLAVGLAVAWVRQRLTDVTLDSTLSLLTPFLAFLPAEQIHASGVLAVVTAGIYLGHRAPVVQSAESRLTQHSLWRTIDFLLTGAVFLLVGLQLRAIVDGLASSAGTVATASLAVVAATLLSRPLWIFPATYFARLVPRVRERDPAPSWRVPAVISWCGMRGAVSLAAALSLPLTLDGTEPFPARNLLIFLTFVVILVTLVAQGLTLPLVIRALRLPPPDPVQDALQEAATQERAAGAALRRLEQLATDPTLPDGVVDRLRGHADDRRLSAWERLGGGPGGGGNRPVPSETPSAAYRRLRQQMLDAERAVFVQARDDGTIDETVLRRVQRDLDLEEAMIRRH